MAAAALFLAACTLPGTTPTPASISGDYYVSPSGNDSNSCQSAADACATVKAAATKASNGDVIAVLAGTYTETIVLNKDLEIVGAGPNSQLLGGGSGPVLLVNNSFVRLEDLAVQAGNSTEGGCIYNDGGRLLLNNVLVQKCEADRGAGIYNLGQIEIVDSTIQDNAATTYGGGLFHAANASQATIVNSVFERNNAPSVGDTSVGGAAVVNQSGMTIEDSRFLDNVGKETIFNLDAKLSAEDSRIAANSSAGLRAVSFDQNIDASVYLINVDVDDNGGNGINAANTSLTLEDSRITNNVAQGISFVGDELTLLNSNLLNNGAPLTSGNGGGLRAVNATVQIKEGEIRGNQVPDDGGGIFYEDANGQGNLEISGTLIEANQAQRGGGLYFASGSAHLGRTGRWHLRR